MAPRFGLARRKARELLEQAGVETLPVPVEDLARRLEAEVRYEPYDGELSGMHLRRKGRSVIGVNASHPETRQRFTLAHEIGHMILHPDADFHIDDAFPVRFRNARSSTGDDEAEVEANQFAAELLMPEDVLRKHVRALAGSAAVEDAIAELAAKFDVSLEVMTIRLSALGWVQ